MNVEVLATELAFGELAAAAARTELGKEVFAMGVTRHTPHEIEVAAAAVSMILNHEL